MKKVGLLLCLLLPGPLRGQAQAAVNVVLLSPVACVRLAGAPNLCSYTFLGIPGSAVLRITNGDAGGASRVSAATVRVNGSQVAGPDAFNGQVNSLQVPVTLTTVNTLQALVASGPAAYLVLSVDQDLPPLEWLRFLEGDPGEPGDGFALPPLGLLSLTALIPATTLGDSFEVLLFSASPETWLQLNFIAGNRTCPASLETTFGISSLPQPLPIEMNGATGLVYGYDSSLWAAVLSGYDLFFPECGFTTADLAIYSFHLFPTSTVDAVDAVGIRRQ